MRLEDLMERAAQYDENLARDIKDYVHGRKYGLVYEASKPEFVRMWKKPVVRGDIVNILPPRGVMEDTKNEDDPSEIVYKVIAISEGVATLRNEKTGETVTASVDDIVALARFDKPIYAGLKEIGRVERGGDKPYHVVINGENYHALQTLVYAYQGQVDCIYIDPPYNTGATDWKYNNNYVGKDDKYRHSKWLTFMEDRLRLAKKLLNPMSAGICIMNRNAIAMAADSAVTVGDHAAIHNSANKLFSLSRVAPVGVIVYANAALMTVPIEIIVKQYKKQLADRVFPKLNDYVNDFLDYLRDKSQFFRFDINEQTYVLQVFSDLMRGLLGDYRIIMSSEQNNSGKPLDENGMKKVAESAVSSTITFVNGIKKRADYHFGEYIENHYLNTFVDLVKKDQNLQWLTDK